MSAAPDLPVSIDFIGNATTLIRYGDLTLLTDPNFLHRGQHAYLGYGLVSRRLTEPSIGVEDLPRDLTAIVLSHLHGDHWDRVARNNLARSLPVITTPHASRRLRRLHGFRRADGLRPWQSHTLVGQEGKVSVTALPGRHAGGALRFLLPPVMGSLLEFGPPRGPVRLRLYISGDTLLFDGIEAIGRRCPDTDLAVLHLGGTRLPGGFLVTMDGAQGAELAARLRPRWLLPVHYEEYTVMTSPLGDFLDAAEERGLGERVVHCERGGRTVVAPGERPVVEQPAPGAGARP
ncbi:MBL fold metallo-hydrolase [Streptomyces pristinaespiralis]|uniref:MBL fold metallo-hydrolase n=1 Tax=Streptomyces pristinaespiralis TaxID=38300 RepID=A0A0M4DDM3_STRPR|nr:MBL fold metallo-hydrolase [Streptomyces pristinaespiralis]ALC18842.1 MBL fold metallo-hydrolase [Streptomyces pristinaespiralis]QMU18020.1 MBL fold metallo-hydrolase [Streptomyces pristinaespiralis]